VKRDFSEGPLSPLGMLVLAMVIAALFGVAHALGLRDGVSVLSGTSPSGDASAGGGVIYALLYFAAILVAPAFAIAAAITWLLRAIAARLRSSRSAPSR
jgi:hypothetical protein